MEEIRLSNIARKTAAYPPAAAPFSADSNTAGLHHGGAINNNIVTTVRLRLRRGPLRAKRWLEDVER
jgi:hypothetical protein